MLKFTIDWLAATSKGTNLDSRDIFHVAYVDGTEQWRECRATNGYTSAIENRAGCRTDWSVKRADMGAHVTYSGRALIAYRGFGVETEAIVKFHVEQSDTITRIDLAIDAIDTGMKPHDIYNALQSHRAQTKGGRKYNFVKDSDGGETLYIGSRQSEQFLRIYDKGAEQHTDDDWLRVELELHGAKAHQATQMIAAGDMEMAQQLTRQLDAGMLDYDAETWRYIVGNTPMKLTNADDKQHNTRKWLLEGVAPAFGKYLASTKDQDLISLFFDTVEAFRLINDNWHSDEENSVKIGAKLDSTG